MPKAVEITSRTVFAIAAATLVAPLAGGSYYLWGQASLMIVIGLIFLIAPPRALPDRWLALGTGVLLLVALSAFLPASLFPQPSWRHHFVSALQVALPLTRSPQPWITFEATVILTAAIGWVWLLFSVNFNPAQRVVLLQLYGAGITLLAIVALLLHLTGQPTTLWFNPRNFGPFPNRNQTGNLLALAGLIVEALALRALPKKPLQASAWLLALAVILAGLMLNLSRAGIVMFFGGSLLWLVLRLRQTPTQKHAAVALAVVVLAFSSFLLFGGDTLRRFDNLADALPKDGRGPIFKDALSISADAPWLGVGLGNFEPIFAMKRTFWKNDDHVLHPESDWFWGATEWGIPATLLLFILVIIALAQAFPLDGNDDGGIRSAALVASLMFLAHSTVDVSAHRPGSLWPALLLLAVARRPRLTATPAPMLAPIFRLAGLALCGIGACWLASYAGTSVIPTSRTAQLANIQIEKAVAAADHQAVVRLADENLKIRPLDYWLYLRRARARLLGFHDPSGAERDYQVAHLLEPAYSGPLMDEGNDWLDANEPTRAISSYSAAFRTHPERAPDLYRVLLNWIAPDVDGRDVVRALAHTDRRLWFLFLQNADTKELREELAQALATDPMLRSYSAEEQSAFFSRWSTSGETEKLAGFLIEHPTFLPIGWRHLAGWYASQRQFQAACELASKYHPAPALPISSPRPLDEIRKSLLRNKDDLAAGYALYKAQRALKDAEGALATICQLSSLPNSPGYLHYLEAGLRAEMSQWEKAWQAWQRYLSN